PPPEPPPPPDGAPAAPGGPPAWLLGAAGAFELLGPADELPFGAVGMAGVSKAGASAAAAMIDRRSHWPHGAGSATSVPSAADKLRESDAASIADIGMLTSNEAIVLS